MSSRRAFWPWSGNEEVDFGITDAEPDIQTVLFTDIEDRLPLQFATGTQTDRSAQTADRSQPDSDGSAEQRSYADRSRFRIDRPLPGTGLRSRAVDGCQQQSSRAWVAFHLFGAGGFRTQRGAVAGTQPSGSHEEDSSGAKDRAVALACGRRLCEVAHRDVAKAGEVTNTKLFIPFYS